jgi:hypothetical protein
MTFPKTFENEVSRDTCLYLEMHFLSPFFFNPILHSKIKAVGDEVSNFGKLGDCWMLFAEAKLFWMQNVIPMNKKVQSVGYNSFY